MSFSLKGIGRFIKKNIPVAGDILSDVEQTVKGDFQRAIGAAAVTSRSDRIATERFQTARTGNVASGFAFGQAFANPLVLIPAGIAIFLLIRNR